MSSFLQPNTTANCGSTNKIALLFGILSPKSYDDIIRNSKNNVQNAADSLQKSFIEGLGRYSDRIEILNIPYVGSFPNLYKKARLCGGEFEYRTQYGDVVKGRDVGFCNIIGIKNLFRYRAAKRTLKQWCKSSKGKKYVVVYAIHSPFLKACVDVKNKFDRELKIIQIVPDLPEFMGGTTSFVKNIFHSINRKLLNNLYSHIDGYVLLSKYMTERLPVANKPWTVIEGIASVKDKQNEVVAAEENEYGKYILYTGTLARRYGVMNLVKAFAQTTNKQYKLVICGFGDATEEIKEISKLDGRIIFRGLVERKEAISLQEKASLLINPRTPEGEFTKYSFPSKTMEYMASGTPCILYRLSGIPSEYFDYCYTVDELGIETLSRRLSEIMAIPNEELKLKGIKAREFIARKKNPIVQTDKLIKLLSKI